MTNEQLLKPSTAQKMLGLATHQLHACVEKGWIKCVQERKGKMRLYELAEVQRFAERLKEFHEAKNQVALAKLKQAEAAATILAAEPLNPHGMVRL